MFYTPHSTLYTFQSTLQTGNRGRKYAQDCSKKLLQKRVLRDSISMCFDICTINIRVSIRVRGLHLVFCFEMRDETCKMAQSFGEHRQETHGFWPFKCQKYYYRVSAILPSTTLIFANLVEDISFVPVPVRMGMLKIMWIEGRSYGFTVRNSHETDAPAIYITLPWKGPVVDESPLSNNVSYCHVKWPKSMLWEWCKHTLNS